MAAGTEGDGGSWTAIVALGSVFLNAVIAITAGVWALIRGGKATDEKMTAKDKAVTEELIEMERRLRVEIDEQTGNFGETVAAIRQKITETELWNRDNFISKRTFQAVTDDLKRSWERFEDKLNERLDRLDTKLDQNRPST